MDRSDLIYDLHSLKRDFGDAFTVILPKIETRNSILIGLNMKSLTENEGARESVFWIELNEKPNMEFKPKFDGSDDLIETLKQVCGDQGLRRGMIRKIINKIMQLLSVSDTEPIIMKTLSHLNNKEDFSVLKLIGSGSFGNVFLCKNLVDGNMYAIKEIVFYRSHYHKKIREVETLSMLEHHHIVKYFSCWVDESGKSLKISTNKVANTMKGDSALYIVMAYYKKTLNDVIMEKKEGLSVEEIKTYMKEIAEGVNMLHMKNIIHGDLNPCNIFIDDHGKVRIGDFGLARLLKDDNKDYYIPSKNEGNILYRAPEIKDKKSKCSSQIDSFALGLILLELAKPMEVKEKLDVFTDIKLKQILPPFLVDPLLIGLANGLLSHDPDGRFTPEMVLHMLAN